MAYFIDFAGDAPLPFDFDRRIIIDASSKEELEERLSILFDQECYITFIDCLDMTNRQYDTEVNLGMTTLNANSYVAKIM